MCGRFTLSASPEVLVAELGLDEPPPPLEPHFNVAPSQQVAAVRRAPEGGRRLQLLRWGLIPGWAQDPSVGYRLINARAETAAEKPAFRAAFKRRRCLVVADGFYEWQARGRGRPKQPFLIRRRDARPFAFAGLWEHWRPKEGEPIESCTIVTTAANTLVADLHDRMPVILDPADYDLWLDPQEQDAERLRGLLRPCPDAWLECYPVGRFVNDPRTDDPRCIERVEAEPDLLSLLRRR